MSCDDTEPLTWQTAINQSGELHETTRLKPVLNRAIVMRCSDRSSGPINT